MIITRFERSYNLWLSRNDKILLSPSKYSSSVAYYLVAVSELWDCSAIRVTHGRGIYGRVLMFGVPFHRAVEIAMERGYVKSQFYIPDQRDDVHYAALLLHINRRKESNNGAIELQAWQYCPGVSEVFYIHAESPDFEEYATHLDGAVIGFGSDQVAQLFTGCEKITDDSYEKQFRLDGRIPVREIYNIIRHYMPIKELVNEAFEISI